MADLTPLGTANAIKETVDATMRQIVIPDIQDRLPRIVQGELIEVVKYLIGRDLERYAREAVRDAIAGKLKVTVEVVG